MAHRVGSPDALILLSSFGAVALLAPLRAVTEVASPVAFVATLLLFMAPGVLITHWFLGDSISGLSVAPVAFAVSTGVFGLLGVPFLISHRSIESYLWASGAVLAASLAMAGWRVLRTFPPEARTDADGDDGAHGHPAGWLWAPLALLGGGLAFVATRRVPSNYDDAWVYLSWVRDFMGAERLALRDPYFGEKTAELSRVKVNG